MGEVERIRASLGASFGHDLGQRVNAAGDRQPKKHQDDDQDHPKEDALELHVEGADDANPHVLHLPLESTDHLDLTA